MAEFRIEVLRREFEGLDVHSIGILKRTLLFLEGNRIGHCIDYTIGRLSSGSEFIGLTFEILNPTINVNELQTEYSDMGAYDYVISYNFDFNAFEIVLKPKQEVQEESKPRISKTQYYLGIAKAVSERSTCLRRRYGAVIVRNDRIVATGYNGAARGCRNCCDTGKCARKDIPHGERYELCRAVHAEQNAIMQAGQELTEGATLYLVGVDSDTGKTLSDIDCCMMCKRAVINAGIEKVVFADGENEEHIDVYANEKKCASYGSLEPFNISVRDPKYWRD